MTSKTKMETLELDRRALAIFEEIVDQDVADWRALAARACGEDRELSARVLALLDKAAVEDGLLQTGGIAAWLQDEEEPLPERVGPYRITGLLGRGGMGVVARAERDDGVFEQQVAIKLMRGSLTSADALGRFLAERRILGRLVAPGIARILDGGSLGGTPWLAMDLVEGRSITGHAKAEALALDARLALFRQACEAVGFAHRQLVIHADIKPSNIMVDAAGTVKLVDFGIARMISDDGVPVEQSAGALTRQYASPERLAGQPPGVEGDVYSLGMVLRELMEGQATDADLAAIIDKAAAEDPIARYPDVPGLIADLDARGAHRLVSARSTPAVERGFKFIRRHRLASAIGALLLAATTVSTTQYFRAERARDQAEARFYEVRDLARFMLFPLYDRLSDAPGTAAARAELAETAGRYLDRLAQMKDAPEDLRLDTARGYRRLATVLGAKGESNLGRTEEAKAVLDKADALLATLSSRSAEAAEERGWAKIVRWSTLQDNIESNRINGEAKALFEAAAKADPARQGAQLGLLQIEKNNAFNLLWNDRPGEAAALFKSLLPRLRAISWNADWARQARVLEYTLLAQAGDATYYTEDVAGSLDWFRQAQALVDSELAKNPTQLWWDRFGDNMYNMSGSVMELPGKDGEALALAQRGIDAMEARLAIAYDETIEKRLTSLLGQKSLVLEEMGRIDESIATMRRYISIREARLKGNPEGQQSNRDMAVAYTAFAEQLERQNRAAEACVTARKASAIWQHMADKGWLMGTDARVQLDKVDTVIKASCR